MLISLRIIGFDWKCFGLWQMCWEAALMFELSLLAAYCVKYFERLLKRRLNENVTFSDLNPKPSKPTTIFNLIVFPQKNF